MVKVTKLPDGKKQFYIDVDDMPTDKAMEFINQVKKQIAK